MTVAVPTLAEVIHAGRVDVRHLRERATEDALEHALLLSDQAVTAEFLGHHARARYLRTWSDRAVRS